MSQTPVHVSSSDVLFSQLRDLNFADVGRWLSKTAKSVNSSYEERHSAKTVSQMKQFTSKLAGIQALHTSLGFHTKIAEYLKTNHFNSDFHQNLEIQQSFLSSLDVQPSIQNLLNNIYRNSRKELCLRLFCLASQVGILKTKSFEVLENEIISVRLIIF
jgi:hypothetical protein